MTYINLYKVKRVFSHKQNKKVWLFVSDILNTSYISKTKKLTLDKAKDLNDHFNMKSSGA